MKLRTHEDMLDSVIGVKGTPRRDKLENDIEAYLIGKAIKETRQKKTTTHPKTIRRISRCTRSSNFQDRKWEKYHLLHYCKSIQGIGSQNCKP